MPSQPKVSIRNTPLPFFPKSKFRKDLEFALKLAKDHIEGANPSEALHREALMVRRRAVFSINRNYPQNISSGSNTWGDAYLLDLVGTIWDPAFLGTISEEETPHSLRERAKQCMVMAGSISVIEIPDSRERAFWSDSELRQFSNASKLVAQAEIFLEFARVREEAHSSKP